MLSRFHLIPERHGRTDRQTDGWTDGQNCYINIARRKKRLHACLKVKGHHFEHLLKQEAQISQTGHAMPRVVEYFG